MNQLRYVIRNGEKVLQMGYTQEVYDFKEFDPARPHLVSRTMSYESVWIDIPTCDEETGEPLEEK